MHIYKVKQSRFIAPDTLLLSLQPKRNKDKLDFYPGQYAAMGFKHYGRPSPMRCFSIVSSPSSDELQFAMRVQGDFTRAIADLEIGNTVFIRGPFGEFVTDERYDRSVVGMAGGIGITPFISMIRHATETHSTLPITLLYSCQSQDNIPFRQELLDLEQANPRFKVAFFITNGATDKLKGARVLSGRIDDARLNQLTNEQYNRFTYFICGPKNFNKAMKRTLSDHNTNQERIITEEFTPSSQVGSVSVIPKHSITRWTYGLTGASLILGTAFIMTIDLARALPKITQAETAAQTQSVTQTQNTTPTTASTPITSNNSSNSGSSTNTSATNSTNTTTPPATSQTTTPTTPATQPTQTTQPTQSTPQPTQTTTYQPPVTSVS